MGRPREFDVDDALDRAMRVFWAKGYQGASLDDLLAAMGIGRGSLYKAFGDKRSLYLAELQRYDAEIVDHAVRRLCDAAGGDGRARIARLLHDDIDAVEHGDDRYGCFLCNASVDQAPHDPAVAEAVRRSIDRLDAAFAHVLADLPGEEGDQAARLARARQATANYLGFRVLSRAGCDVGRLRALADTIVARL